MIQHLQTDFGVGGESKGGVSRLNVPIATLGHLACLHGNLNFQVTCVVHHQGFFTPIFRTVFGIEELFEKPR